MRTIVIALLCLILTVSCNQQEDNRPQVEEETSKHESLKACTKEAKQCPDGRVVGRNPKNNCEFDPCPKVSEQTNPKIENQKMCTADVKECPDGSYVGRDHSKDCQFKECPSDKNGRDSFKKDNSVMCTADVKECPDGSYVGRDHKNNCKFKPCPDGSKAKTK